MSKPQKKSAGSSRAKAAAHKVVSLDPVTLDDALAESGDQINSILDQNGSATVDQVAALHRESLMRSISVGMIQTDLEEDEAWDRISGHLDIKP